MNGESRESAMEVIGKIREITRKEVGEKRIDAVETLVVPRLLEKVKEMN